MWTLKAQRGSLGEAKEVGVYGEDRECDGALQRLTLQKVGSQGGASLVWHRLLSPSLFFSLCRASGLHIIPASHSHDEVLLRICSSVNTGRIVASLNFTYLSLLMSLRIGVVVSAFRSSGHRHCEVEDWTGIHWSSWSFEVSCLTSSWAVAAWLWDFVTLRNFSEHNVTWRC